MNAVLSLVELIKHPVLDLGCGDGQFAKLIFSDVDVGVDLDMVTLDRASELRLYRHLCVADVGDTLPFTDGSFTSVFSNCVMEHIPRLEQAVAEAVRVLMPGGILIFTVPTPHFLSYASEFYGERDARLFNEQQGHLHLLSFAQWTKLLSANGLTDIQHKQYCSRAAMRWFRLFSTKAFRGVEVVFRKPIHRLLMPLVINLVENSLNLDEGAGMIVWGRKT